MLNRQETNNLYKEALEKAAAQNSLPQTLRYLATSDLFFLLTYVLKRKDIDRDWLYDRCREVQQSPNGYLDLWSREHYKSTIITYGLTILDILNNPEITVGIFSHTRPIAKAFLNQIKREFESNELLLELFPEIVWNNPREAPRWSLDSGIVVRRKGNPKEATVEAFGLTDGQPTSRHYQLMVYDDVVSRESVSTSDMIQKTTEAWELSRNLTAETGVTRYIGTRYHLNDTYKTIIERKAAIPRIYPGAINGVPVLWAQDYHDEKRRDMGPYTYACQILQDPKADNAMGFEQEWLRFWEAKIYNNMNKFIIVDPANEKKKKSDYTAMVVVGYGDDKNYYVIDMVRDRLNLTEKTNKLMELHRAYRPLRVYYEKYGMQSDVQHIKYVMDQENYRFAIHEIGGMMSKEDRIRRLIPLFEQQRIYLPHQLYRRNYEGDYVNLVDDFISNEYLSFPVGAHDDMLDALSRICDDEVKIVEPQKPVVRKPFKAQTNMKMARR